MTPRLINLTLLVTSLLCYLEWGGGNSGFLFQLEFELFQQEDLAHSFAHIMVLAPLLGQALLIITLFQKNPGKWLTLVGIFMLSVLVLMIFLIGMLGLNYKIFLSTLPFLLTVALHFKKRKLYN